MVVGTPGRINDHINRKTLNLSHVKTLVLDEADIMLDMGFKEEMDEILAATSKDRQIWLFSATVKPGINQIMHEHMENTVTVRASSQNVGTTNTKQYLLISAYATIASLHCADSSIAIQIFMALSSAKPKCLLQKLQTN